MLSDSESLDIRPTDIGIRFKPPAIVLFYEDLSMNLHRRTMPIRGLRKNSVVNQFVHDLKERHVKYLQSVPSFKIEKMIRLLQEHMRGETLKDSLDIVAKEFQIDPDEDLNTLDDEALKRKKEIMDETFILYHKTVDDPDFRYDVRVDFTPDPKAKSEWDTEEEEKDF